MLAPSKRRREGTRLKNADDMLRLPNGIHRRELGDGTRVFVKVRHDAPPGFFAAEARGLGALAAARALRVPKVLAQGEGAIALEDLGEGRAAARGWERAGADLAVLHRNTAARFGFHAPGWCGDGAQDNSWEVDGFRFFAERRLLAQGRLARDGGYLESRDVVRLEALCQRLPSLLPDRTCALIHGDLWSGNLHACADGGLALIDGAAVHYGWAECDLAMLVLFGEPDRALFRSYEAAAGIEDDWRSRAPILNLYHLLNHLNLFGPAYLAAVRHVLARWG